MGYVYATINKDTLAHICKEKGVSSEFLASKTKLNMSRLNQWLTPTDINLPTINQAKKIAACLHIPFAGLYMNPCDIPLKRIPNIRNMRTMSGAVSIDDSSLNIAMIDVLLERDFLLSADDEFGITPPDFEPLIPDSDSVDEWANAIRKQFAIDLGEQYKCSSTRQFYLYVRDKIETKGVFVHCFTDVTIDTARGFSIYNTLLPIIGINDEDRPPAKTFTIIHELVHLFKRESSLCNDMSSSASTLSEEVFCNAVAGELLVPKRALRIVLEHGHYFAPYSIDDIKRVADRFSVSREVIVRRLLELRKIDQSEYETYADLFRREIEEDREKRKIQRENGIKSSIPRNMSREAIDRTSPSVSKILYKGYVNDVYSKLDIARHLNVGQNHIDKFLREVSKWNR